MSEKYYSRWMEQEEFEKINSIEKINAKNNNIEKSGIPLLGIDNNIWVDNGSINNLIIGSTGSGKTQSIVLPMLNLSAKAGESVIVTDNNGELYKETANLFKNKGYEVFVLNLKNPDLGNSWNPLMYPYKMYKNEIKDKAMELLDDIGYNIMHEKSVMDPFWEKTASDYFVGLTLGLFNDGKEEEINFSSISLMVADGAEKIDNSIYAKEYFLTKSKESSTFINASTTVLAPADTRDSILSVFKQKMKVFTAREILAETLSGNDIDISKLSSKKMIIYISLPEESRYTYPLASIFIRQVYECIITDTDRTNKINIILDNFDDLGPMKDINMLLNQARGKNISFSLIIKSYTILYEIYGREISELIKGLCGNIIYLLTSDFDTRQEISLSCGDKENGDALISPDELKRLEYYEAVIIKIREMPIRTKLIPNYKIDWNEEYEPAILSKRELKEIKRFDIRRFVNNLRLEQIENKMSSENVHSVTDNLIAQIDAKIEELDKTENKQVIERKFKKIVIENDKITIYLKEE